MKILSLDFKNINSLRGGHTVDFTEDNFRENPLFAITGPTGSGKTTVLDVISLALFNQVPRLGKISRKIIKEKGAILTRSQKEAHAKVTYQCPKGKFTSVWSIGTARTGNLQDYEMELYREAPFEVLDLKKSEVPNKNAEYIGLDYQQFIKSVLLAQGEFSKFLKSEVKDRSLLLEQITGTSIYRELGKKAYRKYKDKSKIIDDQVNILKAEEEKILAPEYREEVQKELQVLRRKLMDRKMASEEIKSQLRLKKEFEDINRTLKEGYKNLEGTKGAEHTFDEKYKKKVEDHEAVQELTTALESWKYKAQSVFNYQGEKKGLAGKETAHIEKQSELLEKIQEFVGQEFSQDQAEDYLHRFYEKVAALQGKRENLLAEHKQKKELFAVNIKDLNLKASARELLDRPELWQEVVQRNKAEKQKVDQGLKTLPENPEKEVREAKELLELMKSAQQEQRYISKIEQRIKELNRRIRGLGKELNALPGDIKEKKQEVRIYRLELDKMQDEQEKSRLRADLKDLRKKLNTDQPCPLCGSKQHPYSEHLPTVKSGLEQDIAAKKDQLRHSEKVLTTLETKREAREEQKVEQQKNRDNYQTELEGLEEEFVKAYGAKFNLKEEKWEDKIKRQQHKAYLLEKFAKLHQRERNIREAQPVFEEVQSVKKKGSELRKTLNRLYPGNNIQKDVRRLENNWRELNQHLKTIRERYRETVKKLNEAEGALSSIKDDLLPQLENKGFTSIKEANSALLRAENYRDLKERKQEFRDKINALQAEIKTRQKYKIDLKKRLKTDKAVTGLNTEKDNLDRQIKDLEEKQGESQRILKNDYERQVQIEELRKKIADREEETRRWKTLNYLIGSAQGDSFNDFAQNLTLKHLLKLANRRLKQINQRYRLSMDSQDNNNLVVADLDMGGEERSVNTLSGGESFLISLALALALSDLASQNININSLFIDEGFGTLDQETLDQTLDTLEQLQASTVKTIGIISHVESLKERIGLQIRLTKNGQGYSSLKVVSGNTVHA